MAVRILIAAGGTAGHVAPALAVGRAVREGGAGGGGGGGGDVVFGGTPARAEARLVPAHGYRLETFRIAGFERRVSVRLARALGAAAVAPAACVQILRRIRPDAVLGGGGYVS